MALKMAPARPPHSFALTNLARPAAALHVSTSPLCRTFDCLPKTEMYLCSHVSLCLCESKTERVEREKGTKLRGNKDKKKEREGEKGQSER